MRGRVAWCALAGAILVFWGVFYLPYSYPPQHPSSSPSYTAGFNNRISIAITILASLTVAGYLFFRRSPVRSGLLNTETPPDKIPFRDFSIVAAIYALVLTAISIIAALSPTYMMADARYFLHLISEIQFFGRHPYSDFDYAYGPALLYIPVWFYRAFAWTGITLEISYYFITNVMMLAGLFLLYWLINQLYAERRLNRWLFGAIGLGSLYLTLGANGTYTRFLFPFAALLFLRRLTNFWQIIFYLALCQWIAASISPEIGAAFFAGSCVYALARGFSSTLLVLGPTLGLLIALFSFGSPFLYSIREFSSGALSWVIVPYPPMLGYLFCVIVLAPTAVVAVWRSGRHDRAVIAGYYFCGLALTPAALSRCDFVHLMFNGMGMILLASAQWRAYARQWQTAAIAALAVMLFAFLGMWLVVSRHELLNPTYEAVTALTPPGVLARIADGFPPLKRENQKLSRIVVHPVSSLPEQLKHEGVATPWQLDKWSDAFLAKWGTHRPEFYTDFINVATPEGGEVKSRALLKEQWAIVPRSPSTWLPDRATLSVRFLYPLTYKEERPPYSAAQTTLDVLRDNFHAVSQCGDYLIYKRN